MLLSRFWYIVLAAVAGISIAAMLIVRSTYQRDRGRDSETLLRGDRRQIDEFMRTEARVRLDNLVPLASNPDLTRLMNTAASRRDDNAALREVSGRLQTQLRTLNNGMGGDAQGHMLLAIDPRGLVVARVGTGEGSNPGEYVGGMPLIARALDGYVRDDTWELQGRVYRMSARPVIHQGRYVGAIVHAREIDDAFVQRISAALGGASVAFFASSGTFAQHAGEADHGRAAPPPTVLAEQVHSLPRNREWNTRGYTDVLEVQNGQGVAVYGSLAGTVGVSGGGFAVGRPRPVMPADYLLHAPSDEVRRVPWAPIIAFMVGSALLGILFIFLEHDRGDKQLRSMLNQLAERKIERLDPLLLRGNSRATALAINEAFERAMKEELSRAGAKPRRSVEDLDALLGPARSDSSPSPFADIAPPPPALSLGGPAAPMPRANGGGSSPGMPPPPAPPVGPRASNPGPGAPPPPPSRPGPAPQSTPAMVAVAVPASAPTPAATAAAAATPPAASEAAAVNLSSTMAGGSTLAGFANDSEEQAHWREIFEQFVTTKKQCNEPTDALVFDKFATTLVRHKEQLIQRTKCRFVRFQVYVKDGKATLKASPVK